MKTVSVVLLLLIISGARYASAQVYRCTGADGKTAYQQNPCESTSKQKEINAARAGGISFKGLPLGASQEQALKRFPFLKCEPGEGMRATCNVFRLFACEPSQEPQCKDRVEKDLTYGGVPLKALSLKFYRGALYAVHGSFDYGHHAALERALDAAYGNGSYLGGAGRKWVLGDAWLVTGFGSRRGAEPIGSFLLESKSLSEQMERDDQRGAGRAAGKAKGDL